MPKAFDKIVIIYNPNSTGDSEKNARSFAELLQKKMKKNIVTVVATKYAGHAEKIAAEYAKKPAKTLLVSSSGDGGYNEVVNGVLKTKNNANVATTVLPSGNANDHYNAMSSDNLVEHIVEGKVETIEAIKVVSHVNGKKWTRYAHSYVGFGLTPRIGRELTARKLNVVNEKWHTLYHMLKFKHVDLTQGKLERRFSSLVFATISRMSKIIKLADDASQNDGKMEVYETEYQTPFDLLKVLLKASITGLSQSSRREKYEIVTKNKTLIQLDGEVFTLDAGADVVITCEKDKLRTVL